MSGMDVGFVRADALKEGVTSVDSAGVVRFLLVIGWLLQLCMCVCVRASARACASLFPSVLRGRRGVRATCRLQ